jgi:uncharacterized protein with ParB-like and HNH nuclease domain
MDKIESSLYNLNRIVNEGLQFNIPRYQRLFVWEDEQVETLFNDLHTAATVGKDMYYIGGVILVKNKRNSELYDVVDGQQRFTTLWLMIYELGDCFHKFNTIVENLRIHFAIRPQVEKYFKQLYKQSEFSSELNKEFEDLVRIDLARRRLKALIQLKLNSDSEKQDFANFLVKKLKFVITKVSQETDLNKLFETLNNRGEQLSQDEILKARILSGIESRSTRWKYASIWNACGDNRNYIERALSYEIGSAKAVANCYNHWSKHGVFDTKELKKLFGGKNNSNKDELSLEKILAKKKVYEVEDETNQIEAELHPNTTDDELQKVRNILTFSQLLLHTLRIFRHNRGLSDIQRINEKELLEIFDEYFLPKSTPVKKEEIERFEKSCKKFVDLLFFVREVFDKYIIKWVEIEQNNEQLMIKKVRKQNQKKGGWTYYLRREITEQFDGLTQLQSILYHSQQNTTQYWLTPYLYWLLDHPSFEEAYDWLKKLDNILFCTNRDVELLTERTLECMEGYPDHKIDYSILINELSTAFPHYWFYKLDFILWHERKLLNKPDWEKYKITAKNSIEHIAPQNPRDKRDKVCTKLLDNMGNLVLVTRSINSEYGDKPFKVKRAKFLNKKNKGAYDSLKSDLIYNNVVWNDVKAEEHQKEMIEIVEKYFSKTKT